MLKHPEEKKFFLSAIAFSLFFHAVTFTAIQEGIHLPKWARFMPVIPEQRQVVFELVDEHDRMEPRIKKPVDSNLIDERSQESKDRIKGKKPGVFPKLEGEGKIKTVKERPPESKAVMPKKEVSPQPKEREPETQRKVEKNEATIDELREKIRELAELEKKLSEPKQPKQTQEQVKQEPQKGVQARPSTQRERRLFKNLVSEAQEVGDLSLATRENILAPYLKRMKEKIYVKWYPFVSLKFVDLNPSKAIIKYRIKPDGSVDGIQVMYSEGSIVFKDYCEGAIREAAPFDPLPIDLPEYLRKRYLTITFTFFYG